MTAHARIDDRRRRRSARHFTFERAVERALEQEAARRQVSAKCLASAIVGTALKADLLDAIFDGHSPRALGGSFSRDAHGLTLRQSAFVYSAAQHAGPDGFVRMASLDFAGLIGASSASSVFHIRDRLVERGVVELGRDGGRIVPFRLTERGHAIARQLAGADFSMGGEA